MGLTREEFFATTGMVQIVEPLLKKAYEKDGLAEWAGRNERTSFYVSSFPGDYTGACGRKAVYDLLGAPGEVPSRFLMGVSDAGKDIEERIIDRLDRLGVLLSDASDGVQLKLKVKEYWLSGKADGLVLPPRWSKPHILEIKTKSQDKIDEMKNLVRSYDEAHRIQCLTYIGIAHDSDLPVFQGLNPCESGSILYVSRDDPSQTVEYFFKYDPEFMRKGYEKLEEWKAALLEGNLPERPRHEDGKYYGWSEPPCKWCPLKKEVCKPDYKEGVTELSESVVSDYIKETLNKEYTREDAVKRVLDRWENDND